MALAATDRQHLPAGMALCLLAGLSYAAYALVNQALVSASVWPRSMPACRPAVAARFGLAGAAAADQRRGWAVVIYLGMVATGFAYLLFSVGLRACLPRPAWH
jgi:DME family drug/metabolite transporter